MDVPLPGALIQTVGMSAEVQKRERAEPAGGGAQLRERDRVVAADAQRHAAAACTWASVSSMAVEAAVGEAGDHAHITGVDHGQAVENRHALRRIVGGMEGERGLADGTGPKRAPVRTARPVSKGRPTTATSRRRTV